MQILRGVNAANTEVGLLLLLLLLQSTLVHILIRCYLNIEQSQMQILGSVVFSVINVAVTLSTYLLYFFAVLQSTRSPT